MAAAIARIIARVSDNADFETLKIVSIFSLGGLVVCLIAVHFGLDLSLAFF
jgi:hypothetical protein